MSSGKSKSSAEEGFEKIAQQLYEQGAMTGSERQQYENSMQLGKKLEAIQLYNMGLGAAPGGYLTPMEQLTRQGGELGQTLYNQVLAETKDPYAYYEDTFQPLLQQAEDYVNRSAASRGLLRSGIPIEQMGRAGVELAIKEANARQQARANSLQRARALTEYASNLQNNTLSNLSNLYGTQQTAGLNALNRQAGQSQMAAQYYAYPYQASLGNAYSRDNALNTGLGSMLGAGLGGAAAMALPGSQSFLVPFGANLGGTLGNAF